MSVTRVLVRYKCAYAKKMQNRLRRVLVFDTSRTFSLPIQKRGLVVRRVLVLIQVKGFLRGCKTAKWHLRVCLSLLQVEVDFFVDERSVCLVIYTRKNYIRFSLSVVAIVA